VTDPNKSYYFPNGDKRFFQLEIEYLKKNGYKFRKKPDGTWEGYKE